VLRRTTLGGTADGSMVFVARMRPHDLSHLHRHFVVDEDRKSVVETDVSGSDVSMDKSRLVHDPNGPRQLDRTLKECTQTLASRMIWMFEGKHLKTLAKIALVTETIVDSIPYDEQTRMGVTLEIEPTPTATRQPPREIRV